MRKTGERERQKNYRRRVPKIRSKAMEGREKEEREREREGQRERETERERGRERERQRDRESERERLRMSRICFHQGTITVQKMLQSSRNSLSIRNLSLCRKNRRHMWFGVSIC